MVRGHIQRTVYVVEHTSLLLPAVLNSATRAGSVTAAVSTPRKQPWVIFCSHSSSSFSLSDQRLWDCWFSAAGITNVHMQHALQGKQKSKQRYCARDNRGKQDKTCSAQRLSFINAVAEASAQTTESRSDEVSQLHVYINVYATLSQKVLRQMHWLLRVCDFNV